jgi:hypothetical protein
MQTGLPGAHVPASLDLLAERGDWLDVNVDAGGKRYRFLLPDSEDCRAMFTSEQEVRYANSGAFGTLQSGDASCDPVGILSLEAWRDRRPRRITASVIPRDRADLRQRVYVDEEVAFVRGRFRLAGEIGFVGGADCIAVLPNVPECQELAVPGSASMEFRPAGSRPFTLIDHGRLCPVLGFAQPPPGPAP